MENETIYILLIEDNPDDAELLQRKLTKSVNSQFMVTPVRSLKDGLEQISDNPPDLILSDLGLPDSHGLDTVTKVLQMAPNIPLVVLSGFDDEAVAIKAVQLGAQDYLVKGQMDVYQVERALFYAIERTRLQRELEQHTQELKKIQANLHKILDKNADAIIVVSKDRQIHFINPAAESLFRCKKKELLNKPFGFPLKGGKTSEIEISHEDGEKTIAGMRVVEIDWEGETAYLASLRDVTERKTAEERIKKAAEEWRTTFDSINDWVSIHDRDLKFVRVNKSLANAFKKKPAEIIGKPCYQLLHREGKPMPDCPHAKALKSKKPEKGEFRLHNPDIYAEVSVSPIFDDAGDVIATVHITKDITERRQAEAALQQSEEKFSKAFRSSPDMVVITTVKDGRFIEVNDGFTRVTGYTHEEVIGHSSDEINFWAKVEDRNRMLQILKEQGRVSEEFDFRIKSGEIRTWLFSAETINIDGEPCLISITTDITERKQAEKVLRFSDAAFKSIHESVIAMDTEYTITHWNEISEQIYGIKAPEAIGKNIQDVLEVVETYPGENDERFNNLETNGYHQEEQLHRTKYGEVWVDVSIQAIESKGERYGWVSLGTAITQRKLAEEALKRSEEKYRELISTSIDGIVSVDPQMRVIIWNQGAEKIYGYTETEMLGQSIMKIVPERDREKTRKRLARSSEANSGNSTYQIVEGAGLRKDGTEVPIELSFSSRKAEETYIITAITRDITERKEAEEKLREIDRMKSEFLSNVSHELRTPLQSISGFTKLILDGKVPDFGTQQEFLQIVDRESQQLGVLINSLLDMSRLESGQFQINKRLLPIRDTIVDSIKIFHSLAHDKDVELNEDIPPILPEIEVDAERLRQVVVNLLSNAIKFSDPGGSVTAKAESRKGELLFKVSDRGIGIDEEAMSHLFERFYRAEDKLARGGTGLGLYICRQIIEAHGGRIWAESKLGEGSTFSFTLPLNGKGGDGHG
jgi:PAS domain S-box-containing protein